MICSSLGSTENDVQSETNPTWDISLLAQRNQLFAIALAYQKSRRRREWHVPASMPRNPLLVQLFQRQKTSMGTGRRTRIGGEGPDVPTICLAC